MVAPSYVTVPLHCPPEIDPATERNVEKVAGR
jgi:hypothetical protein